MGFFRDQPPEAPLGAVWACGAGCCGPRALAAPGRRGWRSQQLRGVRAQGAAGAGTADGTARGAGCLTGRPSGASHTIIWAFAPLRQ